MAAHYVEMMNMAAHYVEIKTPIKRLKIAKGLIPIFIDG